MNANRATAVAHANIAFIKYWGNWDDALRLPYNDSLSMNLSAATSTTSVTFDDRLPADVLVIDGLEQPGESRARAAAHLDRVRSRAGVAAHALVESSNTFPMGTGIASSASGFAALTLAACAAAGLALGEAEASALARLASGSACRSIPGGFVEWRAARIDADSWAFSIAPPEHWDLCDLVAVVSRSHKAVGSTGGHAAALGSPYWGARLEELTWRIPEVRSALLARDFRRFGPAVEAEALSLHAIAHTGRPSILYWSPGTVALMHQVRQWRRDGLPVFFTLDAGPNVHLLCEAVHGAAVAAALSELDYVEFVLDNRPAGPAHLIPER